MSLAHNNLPFFLTVTVIIAVPETFHEALGEAVKEVMGQVHFCSGVGEGGVLSSEEV